MTKRIPLLLLMTSLAGYTPTQVEPADMTRPRVETTREPGGAGLNRLTFEVQLKEDSVPPGGKATLEVNIANETDKTIIDRACYLGQTSGAVIPEGEPDSELWLQVIVDCGGPFRMKPGYEDTHKTVLYARTKFGEELEPGPYIAALEIRGVDHRFEVPIEVTD